MALKKFLCTSIVAPHRPTQLIPAYYALTDFQQIQVDYCNVYEHLSPAIHFSFTGHGPLIGRRLRYGSMEASLRIRRSLRHPRLNEIRTSASKTDPDFRVTFII